MNVAVLLSIRWTCSVCDAHLYIEMFPGFYLARYPCRCGREYTIATHDVAVRVSLYDNKKEVQ